MQPGDSITAQTPSGTVTITANDVLTRTYMWVGASRSARLGPRPERWYGNLGAYYPGPGDHWREHIGITRGVLQEGQQDFDSIEDALAWIRKPWHQQRSVYRDDGLFVLFAKVPERRQFNVDVIQILIAGQKNQRSSKKGELMRCGRGKMRAGHGPNYGNTSAIASFTRCSTAARECIGLAICSAGVDQDLWQW